MLSRILTLLLLLFSSFIAQSQCFIQAPIQTCQGNCGPVFWLLNDPPGTTYAWTMNCGTITNPNAANPHIVCFNTPGLCRIDVVVTRPGEESDTCTSYTIVQPTSIENIVEIICQGDSVEVNGTYYHQGTYRDTIFGGNIHHCDSFLVILVGEIIPMHDTIADTFCTGSGDSIVVNGTTYNEGHPAGVETIIGSMGCIESFVVVNLFYAPPSSFLHTYTGCHNDGYSIVTGNSTYNESNPSGIDTIINANGCDSVVTTMLVFNPLSFDTISYSGCTGDGYDTIVNNILYSEANPSGSDTLIAANGCDSIIAIALIFSSPSYDTISYQGCQGDGYSVTVMDSVFNESNPSGIITFQTTHCDSIIVVDLHYIDCPDSLIINGHQLCVSGHGTDYSWSTCSGTSLEDTIQCIMVADTGCVCVSFTDGTGYDTLCLQYNLCDLVCQINVQARACVGELVPFSYASNDTTLESAIWTVMRDSANIQVYSSTESFSLSFDTTGCYIIELVLQDSGCTSICMDTICIFETPTAFICCDQIQCDSCADISIYLSGEPPFNIAITNGTDIDTISEIIDSIYHYLACPPFDTTITYTLIWMNDAHGACDGDILTPSANIYLEPKPVAVIAVHGDTLCAEPSGQFYNWVDCQDTTSLGFDQCFVPTHSGCYCVTVRTVVTDCEDTACFNFVISTAQDINPSDKIQMIYEPDSHTLLISDVDSDSEKFNIEIFDLLGRNIPFEKKEYPDDASIRIYLPANVPSLLLASVSSHKTRYTQAVFIP